MKHSVSDNGIGFTWSERSHHSPSAGAGRCSVIVVVTNLNCVEHAECRTDNGFRSLMNSPHPENSSHLDTGNCHRPATVRNLSWLTQVGLKYPTVYADPPWRYTNVSSRAAAENHCTTMSLEEICNEPVKRLVSEIAHLHLWTTNAFLRDAFDVIDA